MAQKSNDIDKIKFVVASMLNEEQNDHAKLIADLKAKIGKTKEFEDSLKVLTQVYEAKIEVLDKIYRELQNV